MKRWSKDFRQGMSWADCVCPPPHSYVEVLASIVGTAFAEDVLGRYFDLDEVRRVGLHHGSTALISTEWGFCVLIRRGSDTRDTSLHTCT